MNDRDVRELLGSLRPRRSPAGLDDRILAEGDSAARRMRARRRLRFGVAGAVSAAAAAVVAVVVWGFPGTARRVVQPTADLDVADADRSRAADMEMETEALETAASAKAALLEMRIERLRMMALSAEGGDDILLGLDSLRRELDAIEQVYLDPVPAAATAVSTSGDPEEERNDENQSSLGPRDDGNDPRRSGARSA